MNFYSFDADGKICKDVAATGAGGQTARRRVK